MIRWIFSVIFVLTFVPSACGQGAKPSTDLELAAIHLKAPDSISDSESAFSMKFEAPKKAAVSFTGKIHIHGAASRAYEKKSYAISLDSAFEPLGMSYGKHWLLISSFIDRSLMRHKLSYDLFLSLSTREAPRIAAASRFVEVDLNGDYQGVYLLMERVDSRLAKLVDSLPTDKDQACMYKAINHDANFAKQGHTGYEQKAPDPQVKGYWKPLEDFNDFVISASEEKFRDPQSGIASRMDLDNAIDFHLLVLMTGNLDGITKNFFLCRDLQLNGPAPKFFFAPWDYDGTFGRHWNATKTPADFWLTNNLYDKLLKDPQYKKRFVDRWNVLKEKQFSVKTICGMIDANVEAIGKAADRNAKRWESRSGAYPDRLTFLEDVAEMKQWVAKRVAYLDKRIQEL